MMRHIGIVGITLSMFCFLLFVATSITAFVDLWVLNGLLIQFLFFLIASALIIKIIPPFKKNKSNIIFIFTIIISLIILIPSIKYSTFIKLYGNADPLAHFSFSKWIVDIGKIPSDNELYYSYEYGYHPGNGLMPAFIYILGKIPLDISINVVLLLNNIIYFIVFLIFYEKLSKHTIIPIILLGSSMLYYRVYYNGTAFSYLFVALILKMLIDVFDRNNFDKRKTILLFILYIGLLLTHYSSSIHAITLLVISIMVFSVVAREQNRKIIAKLSLVAIIPFLFISYELFVDIVLLGDTLSGAIERIKSLYLRELVEMREAFERHRELTLTELIGYFISSRGKPAILFLLSVAIVFLHYTAKYVIRKKQDTSLDKVALWLSLTVSLYAISYVGVGSIWGALRIIPFIQIFVATYVTLLVQHKFNKINLKGKTMLSVILSLLIFVGLVSNYSLNMLSPEVNYRDETYRPVQNEIVSIYTYRPVEFVSKYANEEVRLVQLYPFITFGYSDLAWNVNKYPTRSHMWGGSLPEEVISKIDYLLETKNNIIIPIYMTDKLSGRPGFRSFHLIPFWYLQSQADLIFNDKYYSLFFHSE